MARENQGLQIALIIFVMLTIVLGVTTFIFFRQHDEAVVELKKKTDEAATSTTESHNLQEKNKQLKKILGFPETEKEDAIDEAWRKDMVTFAGTFPEEKRYYRPVLEYLYNTVAENSKLLEAAKATTKEQLDRNERRDGEIKPQIEVEKKAKDQAVTDLTDERTKFNTARKAFTDKEGELTVRLEKARKDGEAALAALQGSLDETNIQLQKVTLLSAEKSKKLDDVVKETFEVADGEVTWVNQRNGTVWIDLGRADALGRQTSFSVYAGDTNDVTKAGKKGSIEVTQIVGDHVAEARIVEDRVSDPIMPGDKIHTPVWSSGEQKRFALTGFMDIDGDGKSDLQTVINLITLNGGAIDAYTDDKGKLFGKMTVNTRFVVMGEAPKDRGTPELIAQYSKIVGDADKLGIKQVPFKELLSRMGWVNQTPVVRFGPGANPNDFKPLPREGVNTTSTGDVSGLFRERGTREPPKKPSSGGAY
jgi:hypothetical protein